MDQLSAIKDIYKKGGFDIGDRRYTFAKMPFKKAKKIFAYMTTVAGELESGNLGFIDSDKFDNDIEPLLMQYVLVDGFKLDTTPEHFNEHMSDYTQFVMMSLQGFSAPFLPEANTALASKAEESQATTLKKPM